MNKSAAKQEKFRLFNLTNSEVMKIVFILKY